MNLPKSIQIAGQTIKVILDPTFHEKKGMLGYCDYGHQVIIVDNGQGGPDFTAVVFFHEVVHWVLYVMEEHGLRKNERFVNLMAHFMYQAMKPLLIMPETELVIDNTMFIDAIQKEKETTDGTDTDSIA